MRRVQVLDHRAARQKLVLDQLEPERKKRPELVEMKQQGSQRKHADRDEQINDLYEQVFEHERRVKEYLVSAPVVVELGLLVAQVVVAVFVVEVVDAEASVQILAGHDDVLDKVVLFVHARSFEQPWDAAHVHRQMMEHVGAHKRLPYQIGRVEEESEQDEDEEEPGVVAFVGWLVVVGVVAEKVKQVVVVLGEADRVDVFNAHRDRFDALGSADYLRAEELVHSDEAGGEQQENDGGRTVEFIYIVIGVYFLPATNIRKHFQNIW